MLVLTFVHPRVVGSYDVNLKFNTIAPDLQAAFTAGLQTPINPSAISGFCPTGNCTFDEYSSLAICSSAEDVTPSLLSDCKGQSDAKLGCNYTVPEIRNRATWRGGEFSPTGKLGSTLWIGASETTQQRDGFRSGPETLVDFYVLYFPNITVLSDDAVANITQSIVALKGSLDLCVKTHHTTVTNGITNTTITNNQTSLKWHDVRSTQGNTNVSLDLATAADGQDYWMEANTRTYFNSFLEAASFYGDYYGGEPQDPNLNVASSFTARAIADRLYAGTTPDGASGLQALRVLLANVETGMSNA